MMKLFTDWFPDLRVWVAFQNTMIVSPFKGNRPWAPNWALQVLEKTVGAPSSSPLPSDYDLPGAPPRLVKPILDTALGNPPGCQGCVV